MLIGRQIRGDECLNIHESNQELWMNAEMVLLVTTGSTERRLLPEKVQRDVSQTCSTGQASRDISLGPTDFSLHPSLMLHCVSSLLATGSFCFHRQRGGKEENANTC